MCCICLRFTRYRFVIYMNIYIYVIYIYIVEHKVCSVTSEPTQSSSRRVSSLKDSSVLLATEWWTSQKWSPFMARNRDSKSRFKGWAQFPSLCAFCLCSGIYIFIYIYSRRLQNMSYLKTSKYLPEINFSNTAINYSLENIYIDEE